MINVMEIRTFDDESPVCTAVSLDKFDEAHLLKHVTSVYGDACPADVSVDHIRVDAVTDSLISATLTVVDESGFGKFYQDWVWVGKREEWTGAAIK